MIIFSIILSFIIIIFWGKQLKMPLLLLAVFLSTAVPFVLQKEYYLFSWQGLHFNLTDLLFALNMLNFAMNLFLKRADLAWNKYTKIFFIFLLYFLTIPVFYSFIRGDIFWLVRNLRAFLYLLYIPVFIDAIKTKRNIKLIAGSFLAGILFSLGLFYFHNTGFIHIPNSSNLSLALDYTTRGRIFFIDTFLPFIGFLLSLGLWQGKFRNKHWLWSLGAIVSLIALFLVGGRSDWISAFVGFIIMSWIVLKLRGFYVSKKGFKLVLKNLSLIILALAIFLLIGEILGQDFIGYFKQMSESFIDSNSSAYFSIPSRINGYFAWGEYSLSNPFSLVFGHGMGAVLPLDLVHKYELDSEYTAANQWMDLLTRGGIIGLALFIWFQWEIIRLFLFIVKKVKEYPYFLLVSALLGIWIAVLISCTIGHSVFLYPSFIVNFGWIVGMLMFLRRQVFLSETEI